MTDRITSTTNGGVGQNSSYGNAEETQNVLLLECGDTRRHLIAFSEVQFPIFTVNNRKQQSHRSLKPFSKISQSHELNLRFSRTIQMPAVNFTNK